MKRAILGAIIAMLCISCGSGMRVSKKKLAGIDTSLNATFCNFAADTVKANNVELLWLFGIEQEGIKEARIKFDDQGDIRIEYQNALGGTEFRAYKGTFKKGYFEVYLVKDKFVIPICYSKVNVSRLRISIDKNGALVADWYRDRTGNIFLLAGGTTTRRQYFFKTTVKPG
jgi:hypothetical protein